MQASLALILGIIGASLLSLDTEFRNFGYIPFLGSTIITAFLMFKEHKQMFMLNVYFSMLNINGIFTFLILS